MNEPDWIDARTACATLRIRPQSLYAYVSRKLLRTCSDVEDPRRSLYSRQDVEQLAARHRRPRARAEVAARAIRWGDPVLETSVSGVRDGQLWFGDRLATDCAETMSLEDVARHHWRVADVKGKTVGRAKPPKGASPLDRALRYLLDAMGDAAPMQGKTRPALAADGASLMAGLTSAVLGEAGGGPVHARLARAWGLDEAGEELVRKALVTLSDHELNPSTFAVRVCASTGASLPAAILAGLTTLSGPLHGGVAGKAREVLDAAEQGDEAFDAFFAAHPNLKPYGFGYAHPLYPAGDPRGLYLLASLGDAPVVDQVRQVEARFGILANVDAALAAVAKAYGLPADAAFLIFMLGRQAGWIAHAIEQVETGQIIRPRAQFLPA